MMKKLVTVLCLVLLLAVPSLTLGENTALPNGSTSLQMQYAQLQMQMAETAKQNATDHITQVSQLQAEQKTVSGYISQARQLQADARTSGSATAMPAAMKSYMDAHKISYYNYGGDDLYTADEWDAVIESLQSYMEQLASDIQNRMLYIQDYMGQYNSYMSGASTAIEEENKQLQAVARGQSLFSTDGSSSSPALLVTSLAGGVLLGMLIMWLLLRKKVKGASK